MNLNSIFAKPMNLNLVVLKSMNLNLVVLKSMNSNLRIKKGMNASNPGNNHRAGFRKFKKRFTSKIINSPKSFTANSLNSRPNKFQPRRI